MRKRPILSTTALDARLARLARTKTKKELALVKAKNYNKNTPRERVQIMSMAQKFVFAGVKTQLTKFGYVRKPALLRMLRSADVQLLTRYRHTDDYQWDAACRAEEGIERCPLDLARDIEKNGSDGWRAEPGKTPNTVEIHCYHFLSLILQYKPEMHDTTPASDDLETRARAKIRARIEHAEMQRELEARLEANPYAELLS